MLTNKFQAIADIISGFTFRKDTKLVGNTIKLLQAKDVRDNLMVDPNSLETISIELNKSNATTQKGDVILTSRGYFRAAIVDTNEPLLASSSVYIIRIKSDKINPQFLCMYLNSGLGQSKLSKLNSGNYIPSLLKSHLVNLEIPTPPLNKQKQLVNLAENIRAQKSLLQTRMDLITNISEKTIKTVTTK